MYSAHLSKIEKLSLDNNLFLTQTYHHIFIGPEFVRDYFMNLYPESNFIVLPDRNFSSIQSYNRLLLSPWFYQIFGEYSHILICQLDVCITKKLELDDLLQYDYVGAPCTFELGKDAHVGNGGFSLRKVSAFQRALKHGFNGVAIEWKDCNTFRRFLRYTLNKLGLQKLYIGMGYINEDLILSLSLKRPLFKPPLQKAAAFCQDAVIYDTITPIAFHGWEKNLTGNLKNQCLEIIKN